MIECDSLHGRPSFTVGGWFDNEKARAVSCLLSHWNLWRHLPLPYRFNSFEAGIAFDTSGDLIVTTVDGLRRVSFS